jgi:exonuclease VII small subunit
MESFRGSIAGTPRMTTQYNRSRRHAIKAIDASINELQSGMDRLEEARKTLDAILHTTGESEDAQQPPERDK